MQLGTPNFEAYNRTLRRVMWADFIDEQLRVARESTYRASLVQDPYRDQASLTALMALTRKVTDLGR
jgi:hypothetical protein